MWWWFVPSEPCSIPSFLTVQDWENVSHCHLPTLLTCQHSSPAQTPHLPTLFTCQHSSPADTPHLPTLLTCPHSSPAHNTHLPTPLTSLSMSFSTSCFQPITHITKWMYTSTRVVACLNEAGGSDPLHCSENPSLSSSLCFRRCPD